MKIISLKKFFFIFICFVFLFSIFSAPASAAGAALYLAPSTGTYVIGGKFSVAVKVNTGGQVINAAEGAISFDKNLLEVVGVSKGGSIFNLWTTEPTFSNSAGTVSFGGGIPRPGYNGAAGGVCVITFRAKKAGSARVSFTSGAVLANDGLGTNILASMGSGNFIVSPRVTPPDTLKKKAPEPAKKEKKEAEYNKPVIISPTHPDQNKWYNNTTAKFEWDLPENVTEISYAFNQIPLGEPGNKFDGRITEKEFTGIKHGLWYLHVKFYDQKRWGTTAHFKIMLDTEPPLPFTAEIKQTGIGEWPDVYFETTDKDSGIDKYEIYIGSLEKYSFKADPEEKSKTLTDLGVGEHLVMVRAVDKAGNHSVSAVKFIIEPIPLPKILSYTEEIRPSGEFFINGSAMEDTAVKVFIQKDDELIKGTANSDPNGNWFYTYDKGLGRGRHIVWVEAINKNGLRSNPSEKISFLVSPPVFTTIGNFVVNYFTVFVSLLFMIIVIIILTFVLVGLIRKKLKKETVEIKQVLHNNLRSARKMIEEELKALEQYRGKTEFKEEEEKTRFRIKKKVNQTEKKILKEIKDVEDILK